MMREPMLVRARPSLVLLSACLLSCQSAEPAASECADSEQQVREIETKNSELELEVARLSAELETERGCRQQLIGSLTAFADGPYDEVVNEFGENAKQLLEARVSKRKRGEKLAIVLDVDETALSNVEQLRTSGYCFVRDNWNAWVDQGEPTQLAGIRPLYDYARKHDVAVVFLSGRTEAQREDTERVLKAGGFDAWDQLLLREPSEDELTAAEYKSGKRAKLETEGFAVVLTVGDQQSDLDGGHAEHTVLIPNPFYVVK